MLTQLTLQLVLFCSWSAGQRTPGDALVTPGPGPTAGPPGGVSVGPLLPLSLLHTLHRLNGTAYGRRQQQLHRRLRHDVVFWAARGKRPSMHYWDVSAQPAPMTAATMQRVLGLRHKKQREQEARSDNGGGAGSQDVKAALRAVTEQEQAAAREVWALERNKKEFWASRGKKDDGGGGDFWASRGKRGLYMAYGTDKTSTLHLLETKRDPFWASRGK